LSTLSTDSNATLQLLEAAAGGDQAALALLLERHRPFLRRVVARRLDRRLVGRVDLSDVVQETHLDVCRQLPSYLRRRPMPFRLWLFRTAYQRISKTHRRHLRAARRDISREAPMPDESSIRLADWLVDGGLSPDDQLRQQELADGVRAVLALLPATDREVVLLRNLDGLSNHEAAEVLGIQPEAAKKRYTRALVRLQSLLKRHGLGDLE
jgi:RNA polymerase sigma-70 factor, ECF subfamily